MRLPLLLLFLLPAAAGAQSSAPTTMYKCLDARGGVTYSNVACEKQGLKLDGTVGGDRVTTMPFTEPPKPAAKPPAGPPLPGAEAAKDDTGAPKGARIRSTPLPSLPPEKSAK